MSVHLIIGPMFSGKTTELCRIKNRLDIAKIPSLLIRYYADNRYSSDADQLHTHAGISYKCISSFDKNLKNVINSVNISDYKHVFIDEIQFYQDAYEVCEYLANNGIHVVAAGLQGDINRQMFLSVAQLVPICECITHLTAIDPLNAEVAVINIKTNANNSDIEDIGGADKYRVMSRNTFSMYKWGILN
jgi:thymidine kinase